MGTVVCPVTDADDRPCPGFEGAYCLLNGCGAWDFTVGGHLAVPRLACCLLPCLSGVLPSCSVNRRQLAEWRDDDPDPVLLVLCTVCLTLLAVVGSQQEAVGRCMPCQTERCMD